MPEPAPDLTAVARSIERATRAVRALTEQQGATDARVEALTQTLADITETLTATTERQADLDDRLTENYDLLIPMAESVAALNQDLQAKANRAASEPPAVRSWLLANDPDQAQADLASLATWIDKVYLQYPESRLPSCWAWHPHAIEELWVLYLAHTAAFTGLKGSPQDASDWHDRQLPGVQGRLSKALGSCALALHAPDGRKAGPSPTAALAWRLSSIAAAWTAGTIPTPTEADLAAAREHEAKLIERL